MGIGGTFSIFGSGFSFLIGIGGRGLRLKVLKPDFKTGFGVVLWIRVRVTIFGLGLKVNTLCNRNVSVFNKTQCIPIAKRAAGNIRFTAVVRSRPEVKSGLSPPDGFDPEREITSDMKGSVRRIGGRQALLRLAPFAV